jgi:hypothetical protein
MQPLGARLERAGRLRPAQQQDGQQRPLVGRETAPLRERLRVLHHPAAGALPGQHHQVLVLQRPQRLLHLLVVVVDDRLAVAGLVARHPHRVQAHRIGRRNGDLLLQQTAEDALLGGVEHWQLSHDAEVIGAVRNGDRLCRAYGLRRPAR